MHLRFGNCVFNRTARTLTRDGRPVEITPKAFELLSALLANRPRPLPKVELHDRLWPETFVSDTSLARLVSELRKAIGDEAGDPRFVRTVHGYGYGFCGEAEAVEEEASEAAAAGTPAAEETPPSWRSHRLWVVPIALVFVALGAALFALLRGPSEPSGAGQASGRVRSIAVLPLVDLTGNPEEEYFALGLTEALITQLAKLRELRVISRTSAMQYRNSRRSRSEIARELDVETVLEGSVLQAGDRVRVTVELIRAQTGDHEWVGEYEREMGDILRLQAEIARAVAAAVQLRLPPHEESLFAGATTVDSEAYRSYLRGRFHWNRRTRRSRIWSERSSSAASTS